MWLVSQRGCARLYIISHGPAIGMVSQLVWSLKSSISATPSAIPYDTANTIVPAITSPCRARVTTW